MNKYDIRVSHRDPKTKKLLVAWVRPYHPPPRNPNRPDELRLGPGIMKVVEVAPVLQRLWNHGYYTPTLQERYFFALLNPALKNKILNALGLKV